MLFWGRRVYWGVVVLVVTALRQQRLEGFTARRVYEQFGVTRSTLQRWRTYFRAVFPQSATWQRLRSRWLPPVSPDEIPAGILARMDLARDGPEPALARCLRLLGTDTV